LREADSYPASLQHSNTPALLCTHHVSRITHHASRFTLDQVEADVRKLSPPEQAQLRGWLEDLHEDRLELADSFKAEIEAGKKDISGMSRSESDRILAEVFPDES